MIYISFRTTTWVKTEAAAVCHGVTLLGPVLKFALLTLSPAAEKHPHETETFTDIEGKISRRHTSRP